MTSYKSIFLVHVFVSLLVLRVWAAPAPINVKLPDGVVKAVPEASLTGDPVSEIKAYVQKFVPHLRITQYKLSFKARDLNDDINLANQSVRPGDTLDLQQVATIALRYSDKEIHDVPPIEGLSIGQLKAAGRDLKKMPIELQVLKLNGKTVPQPQGHETLAKSVGIVAGTTVDVSLRTAVLIATNNGVNVPVYDASYEEDTVGVLKEVLHGRLNLPPSAYRLIYGGRPLNEGMTLPAQNVPRGAMASVYRLQTQIVYLPPDRRRTDIMLQLEWTLGDLKKHIADKHNIPPMYQNMEIDGKVVVVPDTTYVSTLRWDPKQPLLISMKPVVTVRYKGKEVPLQGMNYDRDLASQYKTELLKALKIIPRNYNATPYLPLYSLSYSATGKSKDAKELISYKTLPQQKVPFGSNVYFDAKPLINVTLPNGAVQVFELNTPIAEAVKKLEELSGIPVKEQLFSFADGRELALTHFIEENKTLKELDTQPGDAVTVARQAPVYVSIENIRIALQEVVYDTSTGSDIKRILLSKLKGPDAVVDGKQDLEPENFSLLYDAEGSTGAVKIAEDTTLAKQSVPYGALVQFKQVPLLAIKLNNGAKVNVPQTMTVHELQVALESGTKIPLAAQLLVTSDGTAIDTKGQANYPLHALGLPHGASLELQVLPAAVMTFPEGASVPLTDFSRDRLIGDALSVALAAHYGTQIPENLDFQVMYATARGKVKRLPVNKSLEDLNIPYNAVLTVNPVKTAVFKLPDGTTLTVPENTSVKNLKETLSQRTQIPKEALLLLGADGKPVLDEGDPNSPLSVHGIPAGRPVQVLSKPACVVEFDDGSLHSMYDVSFANDPVATIREKLAAAISSAKQPPLSRQQTTPPLHSSHFLLRQVRADGSVHSMLDNKTLPDNGAPYGGSVVIYKQPLVTFTFANGKSAVLPTHLTLNNALDSISASAGIPRRSLSFANGAGVRIAKDADKQSQQNPSLLLKDSELGNEAKVTVGTAAPTAIVLPDGSLVPLPNVDYDKDSVKAIKKALAKVLQDSNSCPDGLKDHVNNGLFDLAYNPIDTTSRTTGNKTRNTGGAVLDKNKTLPEQGVPFNGSLSLVPTPVVNIPLSNGEVYKAPFGMPIETLKQELSKVTGLPADRMELYDAAGNKLPANAATVGDLGLKSGEVLSLGKQAPLRIVLPDGKVLPMTSTTYEKDTIADVKSTLALRLREMYPLEDNYNKVEVDQFLLAKDDASQSSLNESKTMQDNGVAYGSALIYKPLKLQQISLPDGSKMTVPAHLTLGELQKRIEKATALPEEQQRLSRDNGRQLKGKPTTKISELGLGPTATIIVSKLAPISVQVSDDLIVPLDDVDFKTTRVGDVKDVFLKTLASTHPTHPTTALRPELFNFHRLSERNNKFIVLNENKTLPQNRVRYGSTVRSVPVPQVLMTLPDGTSLVVPQNMTIEDFKKLLATKVDISPQAQQWRTTDGVLVDSGGDQSAPLSSLKLADSAQLTVEAKPTAVVNFDDGTILPVKNVSYTLDSVDELLASLPAELEELLPSSPYISRVKPKQCRLLAERNGTRVPLEGRKSLAENGQAYGAPLLLEFLPVLKVRQLDGAVVEVGLPLEMSMSEQKTAVANALNPSIAPGKLKLLHSGTELDLSDDQKKSIVDQVPSPHDGICELGTFAVALPNGKTYNFAVDPRATLAVQVKRALMPVIKIPMANQVLSFIPEGSTEPRVLVDASSLDQQGVSMGDALTVAKTTAPVKSGQLTVILESGRQAKVTGLLPSSTVEDVKERLLKMKLYRDKALITVKDLDLFFESRRLTDDRTLGEEGIPLGAKVYSLLKMEGIALTVKSLAGRNLEFAGLQHNSLTLEQLKEIVAKHENLSTGDFALVRPNGSTFAAEDVQRTLASLDLKDHATLNMDTVHLDPLEPPLERPVAVSRSKYRISGELDMLFEDMLKPGYSFSQDGALQSALNDEVKEFLLVYEARRKGAFVFLGCLLFLIAAIITGYLNISTRRGQESADKYIAGALAMVFKVITGIAIVLSIMELVLQIDLVELGLEDLLFGDVLAPIPDVSNYLLESSVEKVSNEFLEIVLTFVICYIVFVDIILIFIKRISSWTRTADAFDCRKFSSLNTQKISNSILNYHTFRYEFADAVFNSSIPGLDPRGHFFAEYLRAALLTMIVDVVRLSKLALALFCAIILCFIPMPILEPLPSVLVVLSFVLLPLIGLVILLVRAKCIKKELLPADVKKYVGVRWKLEIAGQTLLNDQRDEFKHLFPKYTHKARTNKSMFSDKIATKLYGTVAPSNHESLFHFWRNGPDVQTRTLEFLIFAEIVAMTYFGFAINHHGKIWSTDYGPWPALCAILICAAFVFILNYAIWDLLLISYTSGMLNATLLQEIWEEERALLVRRVATFVDMLYTEAVLHKFETNGRDFWQEELSRAHDIPLEVYDQNLEIFNRLDEDGDGRINEHEIYQWLLSQGINAPRESDAKRWFKVFDHDNNGGIDRAEFFALIVVVKQLIRGDVAREDIKSALEGAFDIPTASTINCHSLALLIKKLGLSWQLAHIVQLYDLLSPLNRENDAVPTDIFLENLEHLEKRMLGSLQQAVGDLKTAHGLPDENPPTGGGVNQSQSRLMKSQQSVFQGAGSVEIGRSGELSGVRHRLSTDRSGFHDDSINLTGFHKD
eukprot:Lankesteria_metandrocarpae@DN4135_c0_g1_i1.p1